MSLGTLLKKGRKAKDLSRAELAELANVNPNSISKYEKAGEKGGQYPPIEKLTKLSFILDIDPRIIFFEAATIPEEKEHFSKGLENFRHDVAQIFADFIGVMADTAENRRDDGSFDEKYVQSFLKKKYGSISVQQEENGSNLKDSSRPVKRTNKTKAVDAASIDPPGGDDQ